MMTPHFFGDPDRQLFGVHHAPGDRPAGDQAVILCPPAPQEYMQTHWAQRRLATLLARAGVHVLRFDYYGTGDSAGETDAGTLEQWEQDILVAERRIRELSGSQRISFVGYRLGAVLAWRASLAGPTRPRDLVLWDPVIHGGTYLDELRVAEAAFVSRLLYYPRPTEPPTELWGYPFPVAQRVGTEAIDLLKEPLPNATRVHLYVGRETHETRALSARLQAAIKRFSSDCVPEEGAKGSGALLSNRILQVIGGALSAEKG
jgi:pimeloyl-ACP methyl ester carboxylesterase